jgi:hypothetical protein
MAQKASDCIYTFSHMDAEVAVVRLLTDRGLDARRNPVRTDSLGRFTLHVGKLGRFRLHVTRIGYSPLTSADIAFTGGGEVKSVSLAISASTLRLGSVVVSGVRRYSNSELMTHVGYELRRSRGVGKFMDSLELSDYKTFPAQWILHENAGRLGLVMRPNPRGSRDILRMRLGSDDCGPEIWVGVGHKLSRDSSRFSPTICLASRCTVGSSFPPHPLRVKLAP